MYCTSKDIFDKKNKLKKLITNRVSQPQLCYKIVQILKTTKLNNNENKCGELKRHIRNLEPFINNQMWLIRNICI